MRRHGRSHRAAAMQQSKIDGPLGDWSLRNGALNDSGGVLIYDEGTPPRQFGAAPDELIRFKLDGGRPIR